MYEIQKNKSDIPTRREVRTKTLNMGGKWLLTHEDLCDDVEQERDAWRMKIMVCIALVATVFPMQLAKLPISDSIGALLLFPVIYIVLLVWVIKLSYKNYCYESNCFVASVLLCTGKKRKDFNDSYNYYLVLGEFEYEVSKAESDMVNIGDPVLCLFNAQKGYYSLQGIYMKHQYDFTKLITDENGFLYVNTKQSYKKLPYIIVTLLCIVIMVYNTFSVINNSAADEKFYSSCTAVKGVVTTVEKDSNSEGMTERDEYATFTIDGEVYKDIHIVDGRTYREGDEVIAYINETETLKNGKHYTFFEKEDNDMYYVVYSVSSIISFCVSTCAVFSIVISSKRKSPAIS